MSNRKNRYVIIEDMDAECPLSVATVTDEEGNESQKTWAEYVPNARASVGGTKRIVGVNLFNKIDSTELSNARRELIRDLKVTHEIGSPEYNIAVNAILEQTLIDAEDAAYRSDEAQKLIDAGLVIIDNDQAKAVLNTEEWTVTE